jgi:hypothetical protein
MMPVVVMMVAMPNAETAKTDRDERSAPVSISGITGVRIAIRADINARKYQPVMMVPVSEPDVVMTAHESARRVRFRY